MWTKKLGKGGKEWRGLHGCLASTLKIEDTSENYVCISSHSISKNAMINLCYGCQVVHL